MKPFAPLALALCLTAASAQTFTDPANLSGERVSPRDGRELPIDQGASGLQQLLRKLSTRASVMNIVAHPDDEDGGMLTLYSRGLGARVADLSLNRGEGGQNAMTSDFEDALGLLRTQELLAADRYTGVDQFFGTEVDFGFSKTKEEAFAKWTHDRVLYDVVRAIRIYRPLVLTSTWIGGVTDGHGQHQVSGQIAQEAFLAAGDPKIFPELTAEGILPWQPLKIYARVPMQSISDRGLFDYATGQYMPARFTNYVTGEVTTTVPSTDVIVHEGTKDPLLTYGGARALDLFGKVNPDTELSYVQFARIGLGLQKSQVSPHERQAPQGAYDVAYHLYGSCLPGSPTRHLCHLSDPSSNLSSRPESAHFADAAERPAAPPASTPISAPSGDSPNFFDGIATSLTALAAFLPPTPPTIPNQLPHWSNAQTIRILVETTDDEIHEAFAWGQKDSARPGLPSLLADILNRNSHALQLLESEPLDAFPKATLLHELRIKQVQLQDALALALGLSFDATVTSTHDANLVAGSPLSVQISFDLSSALQAPDDLPIPAVTLKSISLQTDDLVSHYTSLTPTPLQHKVPLTQQLPFDGKSSPTRPYFTRSNVEQPFYDLLLPTLRNAPETPRALVVQALLHYEGLGESFDFQIARTVHNGPQPISFVPDISVALSAHAKVMVRLREPGTEVTATVRSSSIANSKALPTVRLSVPAGWKAKDARLDSLGQTSFLVVPPDHPHNPQGTVTAMVSTPNGIVYAEGYRSVGYSGLVSTNYYIPATERIVGAEIHLPARYPSIAYIPGTGDDVLDAISSLNMNGATILTVPDLTPANLAKYSTVILGVRTYAAHPDLHGAPTEALLDFARNGGNVIVQYQTPEFTAADAPYPLSLGSNEKVVDETAPVRLPEDHDYGERLLVVPNKITSADFDGWVEERGHGFLSSWDSHYSAPTETHDPGQDPQRGGLITTPLGKGRWTYIAFALYRQLPEAVPGAFRLFANLLDN
jgi:LmbE family N-acetylglucosaminyl deacetylase